MIERCVVERQERASKKRSNSTKAIDDEKEVKRATLPEHASPLSRLQVLRRRRRRTRHLKG